MTNRLTALLTERFGDRSPVLVDGGMGTLLQDRGLDDGGAGELWNVDRPDVIRACHEAYAEAGARILTTNTFGGTRPRLRMHGLEDRVHELNRGRGARSPARSPTRTASWSPATSARPASCWSRSAR